MNSRLVLAVAGLTTCLAAAVFAYFPDLKRLPLGDQKGGNAARQGGLWVCPTRFGGGGAQAVGPWIHADGTYDVTAKIAVQTGGTQSSQFSIRQQGNLRLIQGNDVPSHPAGRFPVAPSDPAAHIDRNPNSIQPQAINISLPLIPEIANRPSCLPMGPVGVMLSGVYVFNALDARGDDAAAHEVLDTCQGHPAPGGVYHYHTVSTCLDDAGSGHSKLVGFAFDGFGIYGMRGEDGQVVTDADLDECHGHSHEIEWNGERRVMYHYHATWEFPYTLGCYKGRPVVASADPHAGGGGGPGGPGGPPGDPRAALEAAARILGVDPGTLGRALGPPPPNFARAVRDLGMSEQTIREALERARNAGR
jgi:hypothetical protein